jgi:TetR/AcrR family transcriptional regulator
MANEPTKGVQKSRIQHQNQALILDAALEVFSTYGYRGTTVDQIAKKSGLSKPNLLYYFRRKEDIYTALLERTLKDWLVPLQAINPDNDPIEELKRYITAKLQMTFENPEASRLFANEILHGAPHVGAFLKGPLRQLVDEKAAVIAGWIKAGKLAAVDPHHLFFSIWAVTQHYADFGIQVEAVLGEKPDEKSVESEVFRILLSGLSPGEKLQ